MKYSLKEIANICSGKLIGRDSVFTRITTDSRSCMAPADTVFVAIAGVNHNGHNHIAELYRRGVRGFIVEQSFCTTKFPDAGFVLCGGSVDALQKLASFHRNRFGGHVAAITGSNGKTVTKEWIGQLAPEGVKVFRTPRSYNSQIGVALSLLMLEGNEQVAVIEAGISQPGEMERLERMIRPSIGILTNIGDAHQENFESTAHKLDEKLKLFTRCGTIIYCAGVEDERAGRGAGVGTGAGRAEDEGAGETGATGAGRAGRAEGAGETGAAGAGRAEGAGESLVASEIKRLFGDRELLPVSPANYDLGSFPMQSEASLQDISLAIKFYEALGYDIGAIMPRLASVQNVAMRLELKEGIAGSQIINDSYNCDINSLELALDYLHTVAGDNRKILILSDISQSGMTPAELYKKVAGMVSQSGVNHFIGIGPGLAASASLLGCRSDFYSSTEDFLSKFDRTALRGATILIKGGRAFEFEKISHALELRTHTTVLEVNLDNMIHNLNFFRARLGSETKVMAMIKALGYGSGAFEVASMLQHQKVTYLAVAFADEGVALRKAGIAMPIVVLNADSDSFDLMVENSLEPEVYSSASLSDFVAAVRRQGETGYPIHIKLDTGMHRLGFTADDIKTLGEMLARMPEVRVASVFSHLAGSDESRHDEFTREQIEAFRQMSDTLIESLPMGGVLRHISNSAGIERFPEARFDMVRLGIGLYGISAGNPGKLLPASTLKSRIVQIKDIPEGETIGYGRHGKASHPTRIATVPIGYADGLDRHLSRGGWNVMINGQPAPIIGNICMDTCMVDITGLDASEGDTVVIFGPEEVSVSKMAEKLGTIPYEILTSVAGRVKRVYLKE